MCVIVAFLDLDPPDPKHWKNRGVGGIERSKLQSLRQNFATWISNENKENQRLEEEG